MDFSWLGFTTITPPNSFMQIECILGEARNKVIWVLGRLGMMQFSKISLRDCANIDVVEMES